MLTQVGDRVSFPALRPSGWVTCLHTFRVSSIVLPSQGTKGVGFPIATSCKGLGQLSYSHTLWAGSSKPLTSRPAPLYCPARCRTYSPDPVRTGKAHLHPCPRGQLSCVPQVVTDETGEGINPAPMPPLGRQVMGPALPLSHIWSWLVCACLTRDSRLLLVR